MDPKSAHTIEDASPPHTSLDTFFNNPRFRSRSRRSLVRSAVQREFSNERLAPYASSYAKEAFANVSRENLSCSPLAKRNEAATPIIAALSVHSSGGGV